MSTPSNWPLPAGSFRFVVPGPVLEMLRQHPLSRDLYPKGIGFYRQAYRHQMQRTHHDDHLLIYCVEGRARLQVQEQQAELRSGDLLLLPRGVAHAYQAGKRHPWTLYWCHFDGLQADAFVHHLQGQSMSPYLLIGLGHSARLVSDFEGLLELRQTTYSRDAFIHAANQLRAILSHIALLKPRSLPQSSGKFLDLERIHGLMLESIHGELDLEALAHSANLSRFHFIKKYKALTGTTPIDHFIRLKIEHACHLLDVSRKSVKEVAAESGYPDAYYFSRAFKKVMGVSPSVYRRHRTGA